MPTETLRDWGILPSYKDWRGELRPASPKAVQGVLAAMGAAGRPPRSPVVSVHLGEPLRVEGEVVLEEGGTVRARGSLPRRVPAGYHSLRDRHGERLLVVAPPRCPDSPVGWGWAVQLYALRSRRSWGMGDLLDLRRLAKWSRGQGAAFLMLNPLHDAFPDEPSPYYPSSRRRRNPIYIGLRGSEGRALNSLPLIDRPRVHEAKMAALGEEFGRTRRPPAEFEAWLQERLDSQLAAAARETCLVHDLAVGFDPRGADAEADHDVLANGVRVGAPPDEFNAAGQDWSIPPYDPWKLQAARYEPFIQTLRANFRHGGGVRIDHVMGLFRLWWIPAGLGPADGAYVRYPHRDLLAILALEASRAGAFVVGEDLGTVEPAVRRELRRRGVLSYRVLWFEPRPPRRYPEQALAAVTTHDLPTIAGLWTGADQSTEDMRRRVEHLARVGEDASADEVIPKLYEALAGAPSRLLAATLEDACGAVDRPNHPGTINDENWSRPLPLTLEELERHPRPRAIAQALSRAHPATS